MKKRFYILLLISFLLSLADVQAQQKATPKAGEGFLLFAASQPCSKEILR